MLANLTTEIEAIAQELQLGKNVDIKIRAIKEQFEPIFNKQKELESSFKPDTPGGSPAH